MPIFHHFSSNDEKCHPKFHQMMKNANKFNVLNCHPSQVVAVKFTRGLTAVLLAIFNGHAIGFPVNLQFS